MIEERACSKNCRPVSTFLVDGVAHVSNNPALLPPTPGEIAKLAELARLTPDRAIPSGTPTTRPRRLRRPLSAELVQKIIDQYQSGAAIKRLAREYEITRERLLEVFKAEGVTLRKPGLSPEHTQQAIRLYESGLTIPQVAAKLGYTDSVVHRFLRNEGVRLRDGRFQKGHNGQHR